MKSFELFLLESSWDNVEPLGDLEEDWEEIFDIQGPNLVYTFAFDWEDKTHQLQFEFYPLENSRDVYRMVMFIDGRTEKQGFPLLIQRRIFRTRLDVLKDMLDQNVKEIISEPITPDRRRMWSRLFQLAGYKVKENMDVSFGDELIYIHAFPN